MAGLVLARPGNPRLFSRRMVRSAVAALCHGGIWVGCNHLASAADIVDDRRSVHDYMQFAAGGAADDELLGTFIDKAPVATEFFARCGMAAAHLEYGIGFQAGYSLASGITFGYLAARHMASRGRAAKLA